jgi:hypothetical protein
MSEIRTTTTIEEIEVPQREPLVSLADVLSAGGWLAAQTLKFTTKAAVLGTQLAIRGGTAVSKTLRDHRRNTTFSEIDQIANNSASASQLVTSLAVISSLQVPSREVGALNARLQTLVVTNDRKGLAHLAKGLLTARQNRLQAQLLPLVADACRAIGFTPTRIGPAGSVVAAYRDGTRQTLCVEVAKAKDCGIQLHLDADGFTGVECIVALDALQAELRKSGVHCDLQEISRKQSRPAFDAYRLGHRTQVRGAD